MLLGCVAGTIEAVLHNGNWWTAVPVAVFILVFSSLVVVRPGQSRVVQFFGSYVGTVRRPGLWCVLPLHVRREVSVRVRNFETNRLKVNDADGNPIEIAAIVVWRVADTAKAVYAVDDYPNFVTVQAESALRHVTTGHPYDDNLGTGTSLRGSTDVVRPSSHERLPNGSRSPASRSSKCGSVISRTRRRLPKRCCGDSRPARSSRPGRASSRARSEWSRWR